MMENKIENRQKQEEQFLALLLIPILPLIILSKLFPRKATSWKMWRFTQLKSDYLLVSLVGLIMGILSLLMAGRNLMSGHFYLALGFLILSYLFQIFLAPVVFRNELRKVANAHFEQELPINLIPYISNALVQYGLHSAEILFNKLNRKLPLRSKSGKAIIGIKAEPLDFRSKSLKRNFPNNNHLKKYLEDDYVISTLEEQSPKHQLVIGETGSGKSRLLSRMALAGLLDGWKVVVLDFKGGAEERKLFTSLGNQLGKPDLKVLSFPDDPFNLFTGDSGEILAKLINLLPPLQGTPADFYIKRMNKGLTAVIHDQASPPRSVREVLSRLRNGAICALDPQDKLFFASKSQGQTMASILEADVSQCLIPIMNTSSVQLDHGFDWSQDWDLAVFSLDGSNRNEVLMGDAILLDFDLHLKKPSRAVEPRNYLVIIDEAGVLNSIGGSNSVTSLISRSRSSAVGLVIASQTLIGLGKIGDELAQSIPIRWIGRLSSPQSLIDLTGTNDQIESSFSRENEEWTSAESGRIQKSYVIDPDVIRKLPTFYWNLSSGGLTTWVYAPPL